MKPKNEYLLPTTQWTAKKHKKHHGIGSKNNTPRQKFACRHETKWVVWTFISPPAKQMLSALHFSMPTFLRKTTYMFFDTAHNTKTNVKNVFICPKKKIMRQKKTMLTVQKHMLTLK